MRDVINSGSRLAVISLLLVGSLSDSQHDPCDCCAYKDNAFKIYNVDANNISDASQACTVYDW